MGVLVMGTSGEDIKQHEIKQWASDDEWERVI